MKNMSSLYQVSGALKIEQNSCKCVAYFGNNPVLFGNASRLSPVTLLFEVIARLVCSTPRDQIKTCATLGQRKTAMRICWDTFDQNSLCVLKSAAHPSSKHAYRPLTLCTISNVLQFKFCNVNQSL